MGSKNRTEQAPERLESKKVRIDFKPSGTVPKLVQIIYDHYEALSKETGLQKLSFSLDGIVPKSVNSIYVKRGRRRGQWYDLHPAVKELRDLARIVLGPRKFEWQPKGATAAIVLFESPLWITKEHKVRKMDADNKLKAIFDAVQNATDVPDELHWQFHVFKIASKRTRTVVHLYDLGDVIEFYL